MDHQDTFVKNPSVEKDAPAPVNPEDSNARSCSRFDKRKTLKYVLIVTAVFVVLIGLFFAWLCIDFHPHKSLEDLGAITFPEEGGDGYNSVPGYPFMLSLDEDIPVRWAINVNSGSLIGQNKTEYLGRECTVSDNQRIYWSQFEYRSDVIEEKNHIYIEAILYAESHIVGYCVIELHVITYGGNSRAEILDSAYYPPQDGEYQNITMEHVRKQILKAKILG